MFDIDHALYPQSFRVDAKRLRGEIRTPLLMPSEGTKHDRFLKSSSI